MRSPLRGVYIALALATVALGLCVHWRGAAFGATLQDVAGDVLYAVMIAWWVGAIAPRAPLPVRAAVALTFCISVEVSQLFHTTTLDSIRRTTLGQLILGSGFATRDIAAYSFGVLAASCLEYAARRQFTDRS